MDLLDLPAFWRTPLVTEPFEYLVVRDFIRPAVLPAVLRDFPRIDDTGLLPVASTRYGSVFGQLIEEIEGEALSRAFAEKFDMPLTPMQVMTTVRGNCGARDGRIHADSPTKLVTALIYLNESWAAEDGRLRLLRGPDDIEDVVAEVPPSGGTLVAFRRTERSYHGHKPYVGPRRYVMFNWMADHATARREVLRHRLSAAAKRLVPKRWSAS
ncbi:MAG TPA: 2OG-Fe(II) oxygenase [Alphaproteobacteria bacterium]|nr:2OG-Fe(II) oxygenase [Alphaproteobacteria bacterium]